MLPFNTLQSILEVEKLLPEDALTPMTDGAAECDPPKPTTREVADPSIFGTYRIRRRLICSALGLKARNVRCGIINRVLLGLLSATLITPIAIALPITFTTIADQTNWYSGDLPEVGMNQNGTFALATKLTAGPNSHEALLVGDGTTLTTWALNRAADPNSPFLRILIGRVAINELNQVAFFAQDLSGVTGIYVTDGISTTKYLDQNDIPYFLGGNAIDINNAGVVTFFAGSGNDRATPHGVLRSSGNGVALPVILNTAANPLSTIDRLDNNVFLNSTGVVAIHIVDLAVGGPQESAVAVVDSTGNLSILYDSSGPFENSYSHVLINESGVLYFSAEFDHVRAGEGFFKRGVLRGNGLFTDVIAVDNRVDPLSPFSSISPSHMNNLNQISLFATTTDTNRTGIFLGTDTHADGVLCYGDSFKGSTVSSLSTIGYSDRGEVGFIAQLANGFAGLYRAVIDTQNGEHDKCLPISTAPFPIEPPPGISEPTSIALLVLGLAGFGFCRRRQRKRLL
jgi:hypothetical protein